MSTLFWRVLVGTVLGFTLTSSIMSIQAENSLTERVKDLEHKVILMDDQVRRLEFAARKAQVIPMEVSPAPFSPDGAIASSEVFIATCPSWMSSRGCQPYMALVDPK